MESPDPSLHPSESSRANSAMENLLTPRMESPDSLFRPPESSRANSSMGDLLTPKIELPGSLLQSPEFSREKFAAGLLFADLHKTNIQKDPSEIRAEPQASLDGPPAPANDNAAISAIDKVETKPRELDAAHRVAQKEAARSSGRDFLQGLIAYLEEPDNSIEDSISLKEQAKVLLQQSALPQTFIGVVGFTGCGKSSLINALLDEEMLVPTSAMRASTSVVTEISWNESEDPTRAYTAIIEFISREEWRAEIDILLYDIQNRPSGEKLSIQSNSEAGIAFAKISAVYPHINLNTLSHMSPDDLLAKRDLSGVLGKEKVIHDHSGKEFQKLIKNYIESVNRDNEDESIIAYWPLVRCAKIKIKAPILRNGLVLVDLPGLGDSNAGRTQVTQAYLQDVKYLWILSDIVRAIDDEIAIDLLGRSFRRQLLMDGRYGDNYITFVMTKIDQVNVQEVIQTLNLEHPGSELAKIYAREQQMGQEIFDITDSLDEAKKESKAARKSFRRLKNEIDKCAQVPPPSRKRKRGEGANTNLQQNTILPDCQEQELESLWKIVQRPKVLKDRKSSLIKSIRGLKTEVRSVCIKARSNYTKMQLGIDFENGLEELWQELCSSEGQKLDAKERHTEMRLKSFCISTKAYQKLCGRFARDDTPKGFCSVADTGIPELQNYAESSTLAEREQAVDEFLINLQLFSSMVKVFQNETNDATGKILNLIESTIQSSLQRATKNGKKSALKHAKDIVDSGIACATWKAICRRQGVFVSTRNVNYDWNKFFTEAFLEEIAISWNDVINLKMNETIKTYTQKLLEGLQKLCQGVESSIKMDLRVQQKPWKEWLGGFSVLEEYLNLHVSAALTEAQKLAKKIHRFVAQKILDFLAPMYEKCLEEKGTGTLLRMKDIFSKHVEKKTPRTYRAVASRLLKDLTKMHDELRLKLIKEYTVVYNQLKNGAPAQKDIEILTLPRATNDPRVVRLRQYLLEALSTLEEHQKRENLQLSHHSLDTQQSSSGCIKLEGSEVDVKLEDNMEDSAEYLNDDTELKVDSDSDQDVRFEDTSDSGDDSSESYYLEDIDNPSISSGTDDDILF
ncbi:hypothetical protein BP6252_09484 [Coleophoma cylindrospora]|uniref:Uncharacterized protein n=1 Tax=Coleophoma cylindrospora TaxID=1849047 RepID=A0A3D8R2B0_9HELO|nr:hypothetical protein BP6252_09484 [Coleophoma cylindrospora]